MAVLRTNIKDFILRRATHDDYEAVMNIDRGTFDGFDYLPSTYHHSLHSKRNAVYVGEYRGKVVMFLGFDVSHVDKDGIVSGFGGRLSEDCRGLGLFRYRLYSLDREYPTRSHLLWVRLNFYPPESQNATIFYEWRSIVYSQLSTAALKEALSRIPPSQRHHHHHQPQQQQQQQLHHLSHADMVEMLHSSGRIERFLRRYCLDYVPGLAAWKPISINKTALKEMFGESNLLLVSYEQNGEIASLSYTHTYRCYARLICDVWCYADEESIVTEHTLVQLRHLATLTPPTISHQHQQQQQQLGICICVNASLNVSIIKQQLKPHLGDSDQSHEQANSVHRMGTRPLPATAKL